MIIKNHTKQRILVTDAKLLKTEKERAIGLIGSKKPKSILFETRFGIHTFFMKFPIDVIILDDNKKVVAIKESLKSNRIFMWNPKYKTVIELPEGMIKKSGTTVYDKIQLSRFDHNVADLTPPSPKRRG